MRFTHEQAHRIREGLAGAHVPDDQPVVVSAVGGRISTSLVFGILSLLLYLPRFCRAFRHFAFCATWEYRVIEGVQDPSAQAIGPRDRRVQVTFDCPAVWQTRGAFGFIARVTPRSDRIDVVVLDIFPERARKTHEAAFLAALGGPEARTREATQAPAAGDLVLA